MKKTSFTILICALACILCACGHYESYTGTIEVNGQQLFYSCEGKGPDVLLIHGNGGSHSDMETMQRQLAQAGYRVFACDSRGQGSNTPLPEYHYADMADDMAAFISQKGLDHPAVFGWSDGGIIALMLEVRHPGTCSLIITSGANITAENAIDPSLEEEIFEKDSLPPLIKMMRDEPHMTPADMQTIQCPSLICAGEHDLILESHTRMIADNIPHGELYIVPGHDHGSHIWHNTLMGDIVLDFFRKNNY